ncbi:FecR family protein [Methylomonas montana]|uniref:FecR family protein n=1 Tax=Methylomonas montana TaxID=3058963 RepID=UPI00265A9449|nr:FecR family protein [Methylomonas montana]WKJ88939.1 FecR family protein [Methylomonas montana]
MNRLTPPISPSLHEQASHWVVRLHAPDCSASERRAFQDWLALSPRHRQSYQNAEAIWRDFSSVDAQPDPRLIAARNGLRRAQIARRRAIHGKRLSIAASLLIAAIGVPLAWDWINTDRYLTLKGQRQHIALRDGSTIELNSNSQIRVHYGWRSREAVLERGEALFNVAHDESKPFDVVAGNGKIHDIGTRFNVRLLNNAVTVSVLEGEVAVATEHRPIPQNLAAGQQIKYDAAGLASSAPTSFDATTVAAWREGMLVFKKTALAEVLEQLSRYHDVELSVADPQLQNLKVSGDFPTDDLNLALNAISAALPIKAVRKNERLIEFER